MFIYFAYRSCSWHGRRSSYSWKLALFFRRSRWSQKTNPSPRVFDSMQTSWASFIVLFRKLQRCGTVTTDWWNTEEEKKKINRSGGKMRRSTPRLHTSLDITPRSEAPFRSCYLCRCLFSLPPPDDSPSPSFSPLPKRCVASRPRSWA